MQKTDKEKGGVDRLTYLGWLGKTSVDRHHLGTDPKYEKD